MPTSRRSNQRSAATASPATHDERRRQMLDSGTYACKCLERRTRAAVKQLALAVAWLLV
jgi:hypothetical protein